MAKILASYIGKLMCFIKNNNFCIRNKLTKATFFTAISAKKGGDLQQRDRHLTPFTSLCNITFSVVRAICSQTTFCRTRQLRQNWAIFSQFNTFCQITCFRCIIPFFLLYLNQLKQIYPQAHLEQ